MTTTIEPLDLTQIIRIGDPDPIFDLFPLADGTKDSRADDPRDFGEFTRVRSSPDDHEHHTTGEAVEFMVRRMRNRIRFVAWSALLGGTPGHIEDIAAAWKNRATADRLALPDSVVYDEGYRDGAGEFRGFLPDGVLVSATPPVGNVYLFPTHAAPEIVGPIAQLVERDGGHYLHFSARVQIVLHDLDAVTVERV